MPWYLKNGWHATLFLCSKHFTHWCRKRGRGSLPLCSIPSSVSLPAALISTDFCCQVAYMVTSPHWKLKTFRLDVTVSPFVTNAQISIRYFFSDRRLCTTCPSARTTTCQRTCRRCHQRTNPEAGAALSAFDIDIWHNNSPPLQTSEREHVPPLILMCFVIEAVNVSFTLYVCQQQPLFRWNLSETHVCQSFHLYIHILSHRLVVVHGFYYHSFFFCWLTPSQ